MIRPSPVAESRFADLPPLFPARHRGAVAMQERRSARICPAGAPCGILSDTGERSRRLRDRVEGPGCACATLPHPRRFGLLAAVAARAARFPFPDFHEK